MTNLEKFAHFATYYNELWPMGLNKDTIDAVWRTATQSIDVEEAYQRARLIMPAYCDKLYNEWLAGGHDPDNLRDHFRAIAKEQPQPGPGPGPTPGPWKPPTASGELCRLPGPFFMSGLRTPHGLLLGTYRPAKLYLYDGSFREVLSGPQESFYSFYMPPDGLPLVTTECPAGVWKMNADGSFTKRWSSDLGLSLAFDVHPISGGLSLFTLDRFGGRIVTMIKSVDGLTWSTYKDVEGHLIQAFSDGVKELLIGEKDRYPYICDLNGNKIMQDQAYKDQTINFACYHKGVAVLGCNNIDPLIHDGTRRNGYLTYFDGNNHIAGIDLKPPFIMNIKQDAEKEYVYAVASIWNETGYPNPELVWSKDGRSNWKKVADIPMPSVQTIEIADGGVYCYGGKYGKYGQVYFVKV